MGMGRGKYEDDEDPQHTPGKNDGLPSNPVAIARFERRRAASRRLQVQALEMRMAGHSYREIGQVQNCSTSTAASRVSKAIRREVPQELIDATRAVELARIDALTMICQKIMQQSFDKGDTETYFKAQDRWNALHDRRARIVPIQQPTKLVIDQNVTTQNEQDRELTELIGREAEKVREQVDQLNQLHGQVYG